MTKKKNESDLSIIIDKEKVKNNMEIMYAIDLSFNTTMDLLRKAGQEIAATELDNILAEVKLIITKQFLESSDNINIEKLRHEIEKKVRAEFSTMALDTIPKLSAALDGWQRAGWSNKHIAGDLLKFWLPNRPSISVDDEIEKAIEIVQEKLFDTRKLPPLKDEALEAFNVIVSILKICR